jgi:hypothetical protein
MFQDGDDLPLFSGTPIRAQEKPYVPEDHSMKQLTFDGLPPLDYDHIRAVDKALRKGKNRGQPLANAADLFTMASEPEQDVGLEPAHPLREALAPYLDLVSLRRLAAMGQDLHQAIRTQSEPPEEIAKLLETMNALLRPAAGERIKSPTDIASLFLVDMPLLDQEQLRVACLNTKNKLQKVHVVYQGSLNASLIRVGEIFKEPLKINSAAIIVAHNIHPANQNQAPRTYW